MNNLTEAKLVRIAKELTNIDIHLMSKAEFNIGQFLEQEGIIEKTKDNTDETYYIIKK